MVSQYSVSHLYSITKNDVVAYPCKDSRDGRQSLISLLTGLYAMNLILVAIVFEVSIYLMEYTLHDQIFYCYLYIVSLIFFVFCDVFMFNHNFSWGDICQRKEAERRRIEKISEQMEADDPRQKVSHSSRSAGSLYLRLGCIVFGLAGSVYFGLELFSAVSSGKESPLRILNLVLAPLFTFAQMFFIFRNSQLTIHRCKLLCRFGCMHLVATNVCTWIRYLLVEEMHTFHDVSRNYNSTKDQVLEPDHHQAPIHKRDLVESHASENHPVTSAMQNVKENVSKAVTAAIVSSHSRERKQHQHGDICEIKDISCQVKGFNPFLTTCLIEYSIICAAIMFILWLNIGNPPTHRSKFRKQNFRVDCSASTKGLFTGLLFNVVIIVTMIIFFAQMADAGSSDTAIYILLSSDSILYICSIGAILYGSYQMRNLSFVAQHKAATLLLLDDLLLFIGLFGQITYCLFSVVSLMNRDQLTALLILATSLRLAQVLLQTLFIVSAQRLIALTPYLQQKKPGREVVTFLLMINLALFLINTFETQKASAHPTMVNFYGEKIWSVLVHSMVPLTIFYRFHSTVCLAEIWKNAYREKTEEGS